MKTYGLIGAALGAMLLASCSYGDEPAVTHADRTAGAELHPQLLAEFGGVYEGDERDYLVRIGKEISSTAGLDDQCTFTLVNSDVVNAFAVPGCYIYVTRGLMSIVNSEAELAAVLSHEVGHIVGRHSQRQQQRSFWRTLGVLALQTLTRSERLTQIAGAAAGLFTLRYSRTQEYEADDLGLKFLHQAGYDPFASIDMLQALDRHEQFLVQTRGRDEARSIPEWARTHPLTDNRLTRAEEAAEDTGVGRGALPEREVEYIAAVDDLLYGDDPEQGFVIGRAFAHPVMRIAFEAPEGFTLTNSPAAILIEGPDGMRGEFAGGPLPPGGLEQYTSALLRQLLGQAPVAITDAREAQVNGLPALFTRARVQTGEGDADVTLGVYGAGDTAYHFVMLSPPGGAPPAALDELLLSFRLISREEAQSLRPRKIEAVRASSGDSVASLASRMAGDNKLAHFLMLNGREPNQPLRPGEPLKLVVYGAP
ncbi:MAG: M48 family metalloprotease [Pseudomonadota bacterium]|nr:M48 family metalloprotease [Pseudomonadota bacterium]